MAANITPEYREMRRRIALALWQDPDSRAKTVKGIRRSWENPDRRLGHRFQDGHLTIGAKAPKLSDDEVREIRVRLAAGERVGDLAKAYGVSGPLISFIKSGKTYRGVA